MQKSDTTSIELENTHEEKSIKECLSPHSEIVTKLHHFFSQIEQEPLPDLYLDLLNKLDEAEKQQKNAEV